MSIWADSKSRAPVTGCRFGIEVEVEGMSTTYERLRTEGEHSRGVYWAVKGDGSLRNHGVELISRGSVPEAEIPKALQQLRLIFNEAGNTPSFSVRTSTHVHVNVQDLTKDQVLCMYLISAAVEPLMQVLVLPQRRVNLFCLPVLMCAGVTQTVRTAMKYSGKMFLEQLAGIGKYSSVNLGRIRDLGTIEYRSMHGADDLAALEGWCKVLSNIRAMACSCASIGDVYRVLSVSREDMQTALFDGCGVLRTHEGDVYCSWEEARAAVLSIVGTAKEGADDQKVGRVRYSRYQGSGPNNLNFMDWYNALHSFSETEFSSFATFAKPPIGVIRAACASDVEPFSKFMDVTKAPGGVMFVATKGTDSYVVFYPEEVKEVTVLPEVCITIQRGAA